MRNLCCRSLDRLGTLYLCISNLKTIFQHTLKINQTAVGHRGIGTVVQIVIVDIPLLVGIGYVLRKHLQSD
ncbi:Uncharacterised protein [Streptococcus pneumoniae]|nr:Uncharacterised protein [Streptococcus pneumoniae]